MAQRLADGRTEFALQPDPRGFALEPFDWGERLLPTRRFFPAAATVGRWLASSPLTMSPASNYDITVRIVARLQADDRIEFAVQQQFADGSWSDPRLPSRRFFPAAVTVGRWLVSSTIFLAPAATPRPPATTRFSAVDSGSTHSCGLRTDGTVTCWGNNPQGQASAPEGQFSAVSAGVSHSCGLRSDGTITCWGGGSGGEASPPAGRFRAVSAAWTHSCGLRIDATAVCWGDDFEFFDTDLLQSPVLAGAVTATNREACFLLNDDASVLCLESDFSESLHDGPFTAISSGAAHHCALRTNRTLTCWGDNSDGQANPPAGRFRAVSAGSTHSCGLRADETVTCWGDDTSSKASPPAGRFSAVSAGWVHSCGLRIDGTITCWGRINCGSHSDGSVTCWGGITQPGGA